MPEEDSLTIEQLSLKNRHWNQGELLVWDTESLSFSGALVRHAIPEIENEDEELAIALNTHFSSLPNWPQSSTPNEYYFLWSRTGTGDIGRKSILREFDAAIANWNEGNFDVASGSSWLVITKFRNGVGKCSASSLADAVVLFITLLRRFMLEKKIESQERLPDEDCFSHELVAVLQRQQSELKDLLGEHMLQVKAVSSRATQSCLGQNTLAPLREAVGAIKDEAIEFASELEEELRDMSGPPVNRPKYSFQRLSHVMQLEHVADVASTSRKRAREILKTLLSEWVGLKFSDEIETKRFTNGLQRSLKAIGCRLVFQNQPCTITAKFGSSGSIFQFKQGKVTIGSSSLLPLLGLTPKKKVKNDLEDSTQGA